MIFKSRRQTLGQHFLVNPRIIDKIVACISPQPDETILEIGPGKGVLTLPLSKKTGRVLAVETDARLVSELEPKLPKNVKLIHQDILDIDFPKLLRGEAVKAAGNLPYSISSPILFKILTYAEYFKECHFLLQKEVAARIAASPGTKVFAPISMFTQNLYSTTIQFRVNPGSFSPPPKVQSSFISLKKRPEPQFQEAVSPDFQHFCRLCFQHRRKTLANNLKAMGLSAIKVENSLIEAGLSLSIRPEKVTLENFVELYKILGQSKSI